MLFFKLFFLNNLSQNHTVNFVYEMIYKFN